MNNQDRAGGEREAPMYFKALPNTASVRIEGTYPIYHNGGIHHAYWTGTQWMHMHSGEILKSVTLIQVSPTQDLTTLQGEVERYKNILQQVHDYIEEGDFITKKSALIAIKNTINQALNPTPHER